MVGKKCPRHDCEKHYVWDWDMDVYVDTETDEYANEEVIKTEDDKGGKEERTITLFKCLGCDYVIAIQVVDSYGGMIYNCPEWEGTDWEGDNYAYQR